MEGKRSSTCHPLLRGGRRETKFSHRFSSSQVQSLAAVSEALIMPLDDSDVQSSHSPIPDEVAELITKRVPKDGKMLVSIALKMLSFKLGTLLLCGRLCIDWKWPFIHSFYELPLERREEIVKTWSKSRFLPIRGIFVIIKLFAFYTYFSRTDENSENPTWKSMGYKQDTRQIQSPQIERPLDKGIVESIQENDSTILQSLTRKGLNVTQDSQPGVYKIKCDVVVIGSGCGGGVAAAVLANSGQKVLVLEKGNYFVAQDYSSLEAPSQSQLLESGGFLSTVDGKFIVLAGTSVGGGSTVNWSASIKTPVNNGEITKKLHIEAKVTISACGALFTPPLLVSSGLSNPNIGRNLHMHPILSAWGYFPKEDTRYEGTSYEGGIITLLNKVVSEDSGEVRAIIETPSLGPASFASLTPWVSRQDVKDRVRKYARTSQTLALVRDKGTGEVRSEGIIKYELDKMDKENLTHGLRHSLRILIAAGAVEVGTHRSDGQSMKCKGIGKAEMEEFLDTIIAEEGFMGGGEYWTNYFSAHQMGSCRMGYTEKEGAVDENGESWDAEGLFVCDGSVLPTAIGVNPMITIESTAYCIAKYIAKSIKATNKTIV
ncbi:hypothetical protein ACFE04_031516 [Oxalis oulophora]